MIRAYALDGDPDGTLVLFHDGGVAPSVCVCGPNGENPEITHGRRVPGAFVYADGASFTFDETTLRGSPGGLLDGVTGTRVEVSEALVARLYPRTRGAPAAGPDGSDGA